MLPTPEKLFSLAVGNHLTFSFQRTLRLPDDGKAYPLPPGLGAIPIFRAAHYLSAPTAWHQADDLFLPMYRREAMWIGIRRPAWKPCAVQIGVGDINAVSGLPWTESLSESVQNYLVCPPQLWLDGINVGESRIRQFVAVEMGTGYSVEAQLSDKEETGGMRIAVFEPKPGRFPEQPPPQPDFLPRMGEGPLFTGLGLGAGGLMRQKLYTDPYGLPVWEEKPTSSLRIHIVGIDTFRALTGQDPPPSPVTAEDYTRNGLPWFELYDEQLSNLSPTTQTTSVRSVSELDASKGKADPDAPKPVDIPDKQIWKLK